MRKIKFRAWDDVNNRMIYDFYNFSKENQFKTEEGCYSCGISADKNVITASLSLQKYDDFAFRHVKYIELMQSTGLKDKNGVEIYDGDLIQVEGMFPNEPFMVWYRNGMYHIGNWNLQGFMNAFDFYEVIGNIYENKNLLEEEGYTVPPI